MVAFKFQVRVAPPRPGPLQPASELALAQRTASATGRGSGLLVLGLGHVRRTWPAARHSADCVGAESPAEYPEVFKSQDGHSKNASRPQALLVAGILGNPRDLNRTTVFYFA